MSRPALILCVGLIASPRSSGIRTFGNGPETKGHSAPRIGRTVRISGLRPECRSARTRDFGAFSRRPDIA